MVTFAINIPQMLAYIPYMDPMGVLVGSLGTLGRGTDRQVPLGLLLGIQVKRRMAPAMLEVICPVTSVEMGNQQHVVLD